MAFLLHIVSHLFETILKFNLNPQIMLADNVEIKPLVIKTQKTTESNDAFRCTLNAPERFFIFASRF